MSAELLRRAAKAVRDAENADVTPYHVYEQLLTRTEVFDAVARWLDAAADVLDANGEEWGLLDEVGNDFTRQAAEATARAILREKP